MIEFTVNMADFGELSDRAVNRAHKAAGVAVGEWFAEERLPLRFNDRSLQNELGYAPRDSDYDDQKDYSRGTRAFHYWTGKTAAQVRRSKKPRATKKFIGVNVSGLGPQYGRRKRGSRRIDLRSELLKMTRGEQRRFAEIYQKVFVARLQEELDRQSRQRR